MLFMRNHVNTTTTLHFNRAYILIHFLLATSANQTFTRDGPESRPSAFFMDAMTEPVHGIQTAGSHPCVISEHSASQNIAGI